ncbi:MAG: hypothetical protein JXM74_08290 [Fusobacteriaceae bacterium]|nr:hypothetical protein [Fusobacteriaceae bacterium]MBN2838737.1 hypothetical protein [Fusobacteriaceae bacterium]
MKKLLINLAVIVFLFLGGCNAFSSLDKEKMDSQTFDYKLEESMNSGDYGTAINLINNKLSSGEFSSVSSLNSASLTSLVEAGNTTALEYVKLNLILGEANLGLGNLKLSNIISEITESTKTSPNILKSGTLKSTSSSSSLALWDFYPENFDSVYLKNAVDIFLKVLPTTTAGYNKLKDEYKRYYITGILIDAIYAVDVVYKSFGDGNRGFLSYDDFNASSEKVTYWSNNKENVKDALDETISLITLYGADEGLLQQEDLDKIKETVNNINAKIDTVATNQTDYDYLIDEINGN